MVVLASWWDIRSRRIPNLLTVAGAALALGVRAFLGGAPLIDGVLGLLLGFVVALPFFVLGALGGGDLKLFMAVGAFMGPTQLLGAGLVTALVGGLLAGVDAFRRGVLLPVLLNCWNIMRHWATLGRRGSSRSLATGGALSIPYGVAIAIGALLWWFLEVKTI